LSRLIDRAEAGEEVIIARAGTPVAKLIPYRRNEEPRQGGQWRGKVFVTEDFGVLPEDIAVAFGMRAG
jgi:prevent-host-death family protein